MSQKILKRATAWLFIIALFAAMIPIAHAIDTGGVPFVEDNPTAYGATFIAKSEGQQWFLDAVERVLNTSALSINTINSRADLMSVVALTATDKNSKILPAAVGELTELRYLFLGNSGLTGEISAELWSLAKLENIDMSGCTALRKAQIVCGII